MQVYIGSAKIMATTTEPQAQSVPAFQANADFLAEQLAAYSSNELQIMLNVNGEIARENWLRYQHFFEPGALTAAAFAYDGIVFKKLAPEAFDQATLEYCNSHLLIGSFLYGLLRPLDGIKPYRLEGNVSLPGLGYGNVAEYWRPILTQWFIDKVKADDGVLVNLASQEFKDIFDWKRVSKELQIVTPDFKVMREGKARTVVVYAKMCRGAMTRWIMEHRIADPKDLDAFEYEGFASHGNCAFRLCE